MKITSFYPVFFAEDLEAAVKRFTEDLGFSVIHRTQVKDLEYYVLDNNGNRIDLVHTGLPFTPFPSGFYGMRVNTDNFDEGLEYFTGQGMKQQGETRESESSKSAVLIGRDGMRVVLFHHIRK